LSDTLKLKLKLLLTVFEVEGFTVFEVALLSFKMIVALFPSSMQQSVFVTCCACNL